MIADASHAMLAGGAEAEPARSRSDAASGRCELLDDDLQEDATSRGCTSLSCSGR